MVAVARRLFHGQVALWWCEEWVERLRCDLDEGGWWGAQAEVDLEELG